MFASYVRKSLFSGLVLLVVAPVAAAQIASPDSLRRPAPPRVLLKVGLRLTHFSYSPSGQVPAH